MAAASLLEVTAILELSADFLVESLCDENCVASWLAALSLQRPELQCVESACRDFALRNFEALASRADDFAALPHAQLLALLQSDELHAVSENAVFAATRAWCVARAAMRPPLAPAKELELLAAVRLPLCDGAFLASDVEPVLRGYEGGHELCFEAYKFHTVPAAVGSTPRTKPRGQLVWWSCTCAKRQQSTHATISADGTTWIVDKTECVWGAQAFTRASWSGGGCKIFLRFFVTLLAWAWAARVMNLRRLFCTSGTAFLRCTLS
jgi:hypothetical protein